MSDDREGGGEEGGRQEEAVTREAEAGLESLADEMAARIDASPAADREALHDYAVSLVRERLPVAGEHETSERMSEDGEPSGAAKSGGSGGAGALGFGLLLSLVGFLLVPVFAPVGLLLLATAAALVFWGLVAALLTKVKGGLEEHAADGKDG